MKLFFDTNVWIDFLAERAPFYLPAATLMTYADEGKCEIVISSLSMVNAHFICCERASMPLSIWKHKINSTKEIIDVCPIEASDIYASCDSEWKDYEDGVQYFAAQKQGCNYIVTRNPKDFTLSDIEVLTPDQAIKKLISLWPPK